MYVTLHFRYFFVSFWGSIGINHSTWLPMLDTIKLGIPLNKKQFNCIHRIALTAERPQWTLLYPQTGELRFRRIKGLAKTDQHSFHREVMWDIPGIYIQDETYLTVELSLPKLWYGHNIHLLYGFVNAIAHLKQLLEQQFKFKRNKLTDLMTWQIWRLDGCYAWRMLSQQLAQQVLDSLKHLHYPRKKPIIYPTSLVFAGRTYTVKFYLKLPEFKQHDLKALKKAKASDDWIKHLEAKADGVMRYEATLRRMYLERQNIKTVGDLVQPITQAVWDENLNHEGFNPVMAMWIISAHQMAQGLNPQSGLEEGLYLSAPPIVVTGPGWTYIHRGGGFKVRKRDNLTEILQYLLTKFIGENVSMQHVDEVRANLLAVYKPVKAARLVSVWLYVQRFGTAETKQAFGERSYYYSKAEMKKAGVSLIEPPENVTTIDGDFLRSFRMEVPSPYVTNKVDDFRDSDNILNYVPKTVSS